MRLPLAVSLGLLFHAAVHAQPKRPSLALNQDHRFAHDASHLAGLGLGDRELGSLFNVDEVQNAMEGLAKASRQVEFIEAPYRTFQGRKVYGVAVGKPRVVIVGGMSGAERGAPDLVLYFLSDLLRASDTGVGLDYGGNRTYTKEQVATALSAGIAVLPLSNPDGAVYDDRTEKCWQLNRNTTTLEGDTQRGGVYMDHNFPFAWQGEDATRPSRYFPGYEPQSQAETQNVMWFLDRFSDISWYLNLRPAGLKNVRWGWGHADMTTNATHRASNGTYSACRAAGPSNQACAETALADFIEPDDATSQRQVAAAMAAVMDARIEPHWSLGYPKTGTSAGWASARYYRRECGANRVHSLTLDPMEATLLFLTRSQCMFSYPTRESLRDGVRAAGAGLMELLLHAAGPDGEPKKWQCGAEA